MLDFAPALLLATLLWQIIDFLREIAHFSTNRSSVLTQVSAWVGGVFVVVLSAHAQVVSDLMVNGRALGTMDVGSQIFIGLVIASFGSSLVDVKQALDGSDSAAKPPLLSPAPAAPSPQP